MNKVTQHILHSALADVGVREQPRYSNRGPTVDAYLASVGLAPGQPWCAAFVYYHIHRGAEAEGYGAPEWLQTGWVPTIQAEAERRDIAHDDPVSGDLALVLDSYGTAYHVGFVQAVTATHIATVEGNTNDDGSPRGDGVYQLQRPRSDRLLYVRLDDVFGSTPDVDPWAADAVAWAQEAGLMLGDPDGRFRGRDPVTRQELAVVLQRLLQTGEGDA